MKQRLLSTFFSLLFGALLLAGLGSCSLYHKMVHPYRLPTPKPSKQFIAQQKAEKKAKEAREKEAKVNSSGDSQKSGLLGGLFGSKKKKQAASGTDTEAATDVSTPSGAPLASATPTATTTSTLPERSTVRYDKQQLMKKPKLNRRKIHKQHKGFHPIDSIRNFFKFGLHAKPNYSPDHRPAPKEPKPEADDAPAREAAPDGPPAAPNAGPGGPPAAPGAGPTGKP
ncbi:hypothetical protein GCM10022409_33020 [Hymenobacter glaciei]|uniref:Uncharacterized protein n=1 Tax=Hymenobacter glaciei TaxID=877209 RepID=A0ABP7UIV3_9BACT